MRKTTTLFRLIPALLTGACMTGWLPATQAQEMVPVQAAPVTAPAPNPPVAEASTPPAETVAPAAGAAAPEAEDTGQAAAEEQPAYSGRYGDRARHNRLIQQRKAMMKERRDNMERWRSWRRWWNNPEAEDRRMWNRARSQMYRDMAESRREYYEQNRPRHYDYGNWPQGSGYYEEWVYPDPWGWQ